MINQEQVQKKKRRTVHSISFKDEDLKIIKLAAQQEGISFASFLKHATLEYIKESLEYQRLVDSGQMSKVQKPTDFEDAIKSTLLSIYESITRKLKKIEWLTEHSIYYQFYFNPVTPEEEKENKVKLAKYRMKVAMDEMQSELGGEKENQLN